MHGRDEWNAEPVDYDRMKPHRIKRITLHHSGIGYYGDPPIPERIKNLQKFSFNEKNWPDVPYHFKIDPNGGIWEARDLSYAGETNTEYDPTGHALICVIGNFEEQRITPQQVQSTVTLCAWLCKKYNIPSSLIKGHKDYADTLCPGKDFYRLIMDGTIQRMTEEKMRE